MVEDSVIGEMVAAAPASERSTSAASTPAFYWSDADDQVADIIDVAGMSGVDAQFELADNHGTDGDLAKYLWRRRLR